MFVKNNSYIKKGLHMKNKILLLSLFTACGALQASEQSKLPPRKVVGPIATFLAWGSTASRTFNCDVQTSCAIGGIGAFLNYVSQNSSTTDTVQDYAHTAFFYGGPLLIAPAIKTNFSMPLADIAKRAAILAGIGYGITWTDKK